MGSKKQTVTCTKAPRAYVDDASDGAHERYNLAEHVELVEQQIPGGDGAPTIIEDGCGRTFELDPKLWDVNTDAKGNVVERHLEPPCPHCGRVADHITEPVDSIPLDVFRSAQLDSALVRHYGPAFDVKWDDRVKQALFEGTFHLVGGQPYPIIQGGADAGYANFTEGAVALSAATAKTVIGYKSHANFSASWHHVEVSFDGVTASAVPVLVELLYSTWATNSPGTNSTSTTVRQEYGRVLAAGSTSGKTWSAEPTTLTQMSAEFLLTPNGGVIVYDFPLGKEPDCALAEGFVVRCNAPATVNVRATQKWRRA